MTTAWRTARAAALATIAAAVAACGHDEAPLDHPSPSPDPVVTVTEPHPDFVVTPGAFCDYEGANGATERGTPMRCKRESGEDRPRWRADP